MKTLIRTLVMLGLIVWLGAEIFFPVVAQVAFTQLAPDRHAPGLIVGSLLRTLHGIGLVSGMVLLALLALAPAWRIYRAKPALAAMLAVVAMMALTAYSQFGVIPAMERDRMTGGGDINTLSANDTAHLDFDRLHARSTKVEGAVILFGLAAVILIAAGTEVPQQASSTRR